MAEKDYREERERVRAYHGRDKVKLMRAILKYAAFELAKYLTIAECMDEFSCSYSSAFRAYQEIREDSVYEVLERKVSGLGFPRQIISFKKT